MIRIVGLSATLPNYLDIAEFLRVNPFKGLFFFDGRFRPVPLKQSFVGVKATGRLQQMRDMDEVCYNNVLESAQKGHQVGGADREWVRWTVGGTGSEWVGQAEMIRVGGARNEVGGVVTRFLEDALEAESE